MSKLRISQDFALETERFGDEGLRIGIFASSGAGKGYLLGVLLEELIEDGYPTVMVDPESELWTFREIGALVVGGPHGHAPLQVEGRGAGAIEEAVAFCLETATPVVFDLGGFETDPKIRTAFEVIARIYWRLIGEERRPSVFAVTEAHVIAPQTIPRGERAGSTLSAILSRGRKRGALALLETQRMADIANAVISHCNVRFIGRIDFEDDFKRVAKGMPGVSLDQVQALERGTFYVPRLSRGPLKVRERRVTHGAPTPGAGDVTLRKEATPGAVAQLAEHLSALVREEAGESSGPERPKAETAERRKLERLQRQAVEDVERERRRVQQLEAEVERERERAAKSEELAGQVATFRQALMALLGEIPAAGTAGDGYPGDEHMVELIRRHAPAGGDGYVVQPVEALRKQFLERAADRLADVVREMESDEREALLFLIGRQAFLTLNAVAVGLSGSDSGSVRARWSKAVQSLVAKGLVVQGGSGRTGRKENIEGWVRSSLGAHSPTDEEIVAVRDRALSLLST